MSYKTDPEKGLKILKSLNPQIILINSLFGLNRSELISGLKESNILTVLKYDSGNPKKIIQSFNRWREFSNHTLLVIEGEFKNPEEIISVLTEDCFFSYVYIYPNNLEKFQELVKKNEENPEYLLKYLNPDSISQNPVLDLLKLNKTIYNQHLDFFENRILTILV